jgi:phosphomannomutase/phosphoglucomutase
MGLLRWSCSAYFEQLNVDAEYLFAEPDGTFPNHHPDPTVPENLKDLVAKVKESNADMGIGFDGDADRLGVVNPAGDIIWGDKLMILYAREIIARRGNVPIVFDVKCSQSLAEEVAKAGGTPVMWKTGHSLVKQKMKELKSPLGGEMSGHIFFADEYYGYDDALYAAARTIRLMANSNQTIDEMLADITPYQASPEITF